MKKCRHGILSCATCADQAARGIKAPTRRILTGVERDRAVGLEPAPETVNVVPAPIVEASEPRKRRVPVKARRKGRKADAPARTVKRKAGGKGRLVVKRDTARAIKRDRKEGRANAAHRKVLAKREHRPMGERPTDYPGHEPVRADDRTYASNGSKVPRNLRPDTGAAKRAKELGGYMGGRRELPGRWRAGDNRAPAADAVPRWNGKAKE